MKKNTQTLLILGAVAVGLYMFKDKLSSAFSKGDGGDDGGDDGETGKQPASTTETGDEQESKPDAVVNIERTGQTVKEGIQTAKELASILKDANIEIKTPSGQPNIRIKSGKKRKHTRRDRRKWLALQKLLKRNCGKIKSKRRRARCITAQNKAKGTNLLMQSAFKGKLF